MQWCNYNCGHTPIAIYLLQQTAWAAVWQHMLGADGNPGCKMSHHLNIQQNRTWVFWNSFYVIINSLRLSDTYMRHQPRPPLVHHWWQAKSHYLNQGCIIVNWTLRNKLQSNCIRISNIFIQENALLIVVLKMSVILSQCVKSFPVSNQTIRDTVKTVYNDHLDELQKAEIVSKSTLVHSVLNKTHCWINHR